MRDSDTNDNRSSSVLAKVAMVAIMVAAVVTVCAWFVAGKDSPINHGVAPDVHGRPLLTVWVIANLPAAMLFVNVFSKLGSEAQYFCCVFLQWFLIGLPVGFAVASSQKTRKQV